MKLSVFLIFLISTVTIHNHLFAQAGLTKTRKELNVYIKQPAFSALYPSVYEYDDSITCTSENGENIISYFFDDFNRCNNEILGRVNDDVNHKLNLEDFQEYLRVTGYERVIDSKNKNKYVNPDTQTVAYIDRTEEFLIILFKKYWGNEDTTH